MAFKLDDFEEDKNWSSLGKRTPLDACFQDINSVGICGGLLFEGKIYTIAIGIYDRGKANDCSSITG